MRLIKLGEKEWKQPVFWAIAAILTAVISTFSVLTGTISFRLLDIISMSLPVSIAVAWFVTRELLKYR